MADILHSDKNVYRKTGLSRKLIKSVDMTEQARIDKITKKSNGENKP
jgi:hypothetical protein